MNITHQCLRVQGLTFKHLQEMKIYHRPNQYAFVKLTGEADKGAMEDFMGKSADCPITIMAADAMGQEKVIFRGNILNIHLAETNEYSIATVLLADTSCRLAMQRERKSFQNLQRNYGEILQEACRQNGFGDNVDITMNVQDQAIGELILQWNESDWEFAKRIASHFAVPVITDCLSKHPHLNVGLPKDEDKGIALNQTEYTYCYQDGRRKIWQENSLVKGKRIMPENCSSLLIESDEYLQLGESVSFRGRSYRVASVMGKLIDGMFHMRYRLASENDFLVPLQKNPNCAGMALTGRVKEVRQDKVKVHFIHVDESYDEGTTKWFPYSTTYSSGDGSGWYVMPSEGDYVRVFFPTQDEKDAFCISAINAAPPANTRNKTLRAPGGKELLLTDDSVHLITKHQDTFIDMSGKAVNIVTSNPVHVAGEKQVVMDAKTLEILAKDNIVLQAGDVLLGLDKDNIQLSATDVFIGGD